MSGAANWIRDVAITALVVTLGFATLAIVTGHAYASLPGGSPAPPSAAALGGIQSPHGGEPACAACHLTHTGVADTLLVSDHADGSVCTRCHSATGGATEVSSHSNLDFVGKTQGDFFVSCTECHDPHGNPDAPGNKNMIKPVVTRLGVDHTVNFTSLTGPGSFDDGTHTGICVVCHTTTAHNKVDSPELLGEGHLPLGSDCTACHPHGGSAGLRSGFMPDRTATPTVTATATDTDTATSVPPTATDTPAPGGTTTPTPTETPTPADTDTPTATPTT